MKYSIEKDTLTAMADAIRSTKGTTEKIPLKELADEIFAIGGSFGSFCDMVERSATHIDIPSGTAKIGMYSFANYMTLTSVTIPDTVTSIETSAFNSCGLTSIKIPKSVTKLGDTVFNYCNKCKVFDFSEHTSVPTAGKTIFSNVFRDANTDAKILIPGDSDYLWTTATNWATYSSYMVTIYRFYVCGERVKTYGYNQTWQEWIDSSYNTIGATNHDGIVYVNEKPIYCQCGGYSGSYVDDYMVKATFTIDPNYTYGNNSGYVAFKLCGKWTFGLSGTVLENWINSPFNDLGAFINTDTEEYWIELSDGTKSPSYTTREVISDIEISEGAEYWS